MMINFKRTLPDHAHIYHGQDLVGELTRQPDLLKPGSWFYVVHLFDDRRGPVRVHDRKTHPRGRRAAHSDMRTHVKHGAAKNLGSRVSATWYLRI